MNTKTQLAVNKSNSWQMFDDISVHYDFLNHLLSFGCDIHWRKQISKFLPPHSKLKVLDLATGTADVLLTLKKKNPDISAGYGIDLAEKMLAIGQQKIDQKKLSEYLHLKKGDAHNIPYPNNSFDIITMAFGIRNCEDPMIVFHEMQRVLKIGGRALILEFSLPKNRILRMLHLFYLRQIVPAIGGFVSGHWEAYRYLNQTIEAFPYGKRFCRLMKKSGFRKVRANPLLFGIASIYQGDKI